MAVTGVDIAGEDLVPMLDPAQNLSCPALSKELEIPTGRSFPPVATPPGHLNHKGADRMADKNVDEGKGRLKEAAGSVTGDDSLKNEGKGDQAKASVKDKVDKAADKAKDLLDRDK